MADEFPFDRADAAVEVMVAGALDVPVPEGLAERVNAAVASVTAAVRRRWQVVRGVAAALGLVFVINGGGNIFLGRWVARNLDTPYDPHVWREGGLALAAVGVLLLLAAARPRLLSSAALVACPIAVFYGATGVGELDTFLNGAFLHLSQGFLGIALAVGWFWARRYVPVPSDEGET
jgi:hypothetical protein